MKKATLITGLAVALAAAAGLWYYSQAEARETPSYRFATVERGDLQSSVSATGALSAVTTVQVGTQVSGQVAQLLVDFNDRVRKGQLLARIDPTLQQQAVRDAQAGVDRSRAELERAQREYDRNKTLYDGKVLTEAEFNSVEYTLRVAESNLKSAQVSLDRAEQNLAYTNIYSPIDGVVVERNVDVGQTVAASLSAPQLFLIAQDLEQMQILASVDESDIGLITDGQPVRFTVQAHPNESFSGHVRQVRLQSATQENVVSYTVVVSVKNTTGKLLPGMTATVAFETGSADNALIVPNAALRFRATPEMEAQVAASEAVGRSPNGVSAVGGDTPRVAQAYARPANAAPASGAPSASTAKLWYMDGNTLRTMRVQTGITDGQRTVVVGSEALREGMEVIVGTSSASASTQTANPFQSTRQQQGPRPPGGF